MTAKDEVWKDCACCEYHQPASEFYKDVSKSTGLSSWCKSCKREARTPWMAQYRKDHPDRVLKAWLKADAKRGRAYAIRRLRGKKA